MEGKIKFELKDHLFVPCQGSISQWPVKCPVSYLSKKVNIKLNCLGRQIHFLIVLLYTYLIYVISQWPLKYLVSYQSIRKV